MDREKTNSLLDLLRGYRQGTLTPAEAHEVSSALERDPGFAREAAREEIVLSSIAGLRPVPVPRGLVARAVSRAVGDSTPARWFSLDTLLIALGVGIACAAVAQLLASQLTLPVISGLLIDFIRIVAINPLVLYASAAVVIAAVIAGGVWFTVRTLRL